MTATVAPTAIQQFFDNGGRPLAGGSLLTQVGGVNYPTYQDSATLIPLPNPIPLNSRGEISNSSGISSQLFLPPGITYTFTLYDANGNQVNQATSVASLISTLQLTKPVTDQMVGNGTQTIFTLSQNPAAVDNVLFALGGALQNPGVDYTLSGITVTCALPPPSGVAGFFNYRVSLPVGSTDATTTTYTPPEAGSVSTTLEERLGREVWIEDFLTAAQIADGMSGVPTIDISSEVQFAIDSVCPIIPTTQGAGRLKTNLRAILIGTGLDMTNTRVAGTHLRDGFVFEGVGMQGTKILGQTGGQAVIETTGSQWLILRDLYVGQGATNPSQVGIYQGNAAVLPETQNQKFERLYVNLADNASANGSAGTIALWNFGAEENNYDSCYLDANRTLFLTGHNNDGASSIIPYAYSYQTLSTTHSCGMNTFTGETFMVSAAKRFPPILTEDVNSLVFENLYCANTGSGGTNTAAFEIHGSLAGLSLNGTVEQLATLFNVFGILASSNVRVTYGAVADTGTALIFLQRGGQGQIIDSDFKINMNATASRNLFVSNPVSSSEAVSCCLTDCTFKTNLAAANLAVPENTLWNAMTQNVMISGASGYQYRIGAGWQEFDIQDTVVLPSSTSRICQVTFPTLNTDFSAGGLSLQVKGSLRIAGSGTDAMSTRAVDATMSISTNNTGAITAGSGTVYAATQADVLSAGNSITAAALSGTPSGTANCAINLVPTRTGSNAEGVQFRGTVRMTWGGWAGVAPSLGV